MLCSFFSILWYNIMKKPNYVPQLLGLLDQVKKLQRQLELGHITPEECKKKIDKLQDEIDSIEVEKML